MMETSSTNIELEGADHKWSVSLAYHREQIAKWSAEVDRLKARNAHLEGLLAKEQP